MLYNEIEIIKRNNVKISHNPCSNMKLASGIAPIQDLITNDICVGIGTDGASSNNNLDLIEELRTASLLQKVNLLNPKALTSNEALAMGTIKGAEVLGLEQEIGSIEVGKKADLILIDTNNANMVPDSSATSSNIIYSANGYNVDTTICDGKILMENRKLTTLDEEEIYNIIFNEGYYLTLTYKGKYKNNKHSHYVVVYKEKYKIIIKIDFNNTK